MGDTLIFVILFTGTWWLIGVIFLVIGLAMRGSWRRREETLRAETEGVVLEVVRHKTGTGKNSSVSWRPLVEFDYEGRRISLEADSVAFKRYYEGQPVKVLYDPGDPTRFRIAGERGDQTAHRALIAVGAGCLAIGLVALVIAALTDPTALRLLRRR